MIISLSTPLKIIPKISLGLCVLFLATQSYAKEFYKWEDSNGSTHYTLTPPPSNAKRLGNLSTYDDQPRSLAASIAPVDNNPTPPPQATTNHANEAPPASNHANEVPPTTIQKREQNSSTDGGESITLPAN